MEMNKTHAGHWITCETAREKVHVALSQFAANRRKREGGPLAITPLPENLPITLRQKCRAFILAIKYLSSTLHPHLTLRLMILKHQSAYFDFIAGFALHSCSH